MAAGLVVEAIPRTREQLGDVGLLPPITLGAPSCACGTRIWQMQLFYLQISIKPNLAVATCGSPVPANSVSRLIRGVSDWYLARRACYRHNQATD